MEMIPWTTPHMRAERAWKDVGEHLTFKRREEARKKMRETLFYLHELIRCVEREEIAEEEIKFKQAEFDRLMGERHES